ncbi:MAG: 3-hydroxyacyl-CoA dehydrogenase NAD-binding domain-containing protein [Conexivisphaerales archaeon]
MEIKKIALVGAGEMGHGIAQIFAQYGFGVSLTDKYEEALIRAKQRIEQNLLKLEQRGKIRSGESASILSRINFAAELKDAVADADLVIEAVPEIPELKKDVFRQLDTLVQQHTVLASNTSNIRISELADATSRADKVAGMHFFNPPTVMKLVELIPNAKTDPVVLNSLAELCKRIGKTPVMVLKDSPGFIVNRINAADMLFFGLILDRGIAKPEEVDAYARSQGMPMGPYELLDFVGIDVAYDSLMYFARTISPEYGKCKTFSLMYSEKKLGKKTGNGFYDWSSGKPLLSGAKPTDKLSLMDLFAIEINEAVKLIQEGIAKPSDIDTAVTLGMNRPFGPISVAKSFTSSEIAQKLNELSQRFDCKIFSPAEPIAQGKMREVIEGKVLESEKQIEKTTAKEKTDVVLVEKLDGKVARITINRPRLNTINNEVLDHIDTALSNLWDDKDVNVVILQGAGDIFSAGADLAQFFSNPVDFMEFSRRGERIFKRFAEFPKLTIAAVKGYALGGGLELAMACDLRVVSEDCRIGLPEVTRALVPGWSGTQRIVKLIGLSKASEIVLTGQMITGRRAYEIGLANYVMQQSEIDEKVLSLARELASSLAPVSVMLAKRLINKAAEVPMDVGLEMESAFLGMLFGTEDLKEGLASFMQKRKAEYKGR